MSDHRLSELFSQLKADQDARAILPIPGLAERCMDEAWGPTVELPVPLTKSPSRMQTLRWILVPVTAGCVFFAGFLLATRTDRPILQGKAGSDAVAIETGKSISAAAENDLPLRFSDGSVVTIQPKAIAQVTRFTASGAEVVLEQGELLADIVHAPGTHWQVIAGPFRVLVTGTRFHTTYQPDLQRLEVRLYQGGVLVQGPMLGNGIPLVAGQKLDVGVGQAVVVRPLHRSLASQPIPPRIEPLTPPTANDPVPTSSLTNEEPEIPTTTPIPPATSTKTSRRPDWATLADQGKYEAALAAAEEVGFLALCTRLPARRLITLADVARFAGDPALTRKAFESLVERFPRDRHAADALFGLGRLAAETGNPRQAARWFERYLRNWPTDPLVEQAAGRLLELYQTMGDDTSAVARAKDYLENHPTGMRVTHAKRILSEHGVEDQD